jgi:predicted methyltransferase
MRRNVLMVFTACLIGACASAPEVAAPSTPSPAPKTETRDEATAAAIELALAGAHRSAGNRARDAYRHPLDTLLFFGIKPDMTVVEVWPGVDGWYTEVLAPLLAERGKLYSALPPSRPDNAYTTASLKRYADKLAARPDLYGRVEVTSLGSGQFAIAPPGSADLVMTFRNLHTWMNLGIANEAIAGINRALKPGGIFGVVENRGDPAKPQDPQAVNGYVNEEYAIAMIEAAGFELLARSPVNDNPKDTKDYLQGVWTLPPNYRMGKRDREKYEAIGESDRFTLKFRKR